MRRCIALRHSSHKRRSARYHSSATMNTADIVGQSSDNSRLIPISPCRCIEHSVCTHCDAVPSFCSGGACPPHAVVLKASGYPSKLGEQLDSLTIVTPDFCGEDCFMYNLSIDLSFIVEFGMLVPLIASGVPSFIAAAKTALADSASQA